MAHYSKAVSLAGTVMRYFLSLAGTKSALALGVTKPPVAGRAIAFTGRTLGLAPGNLRTAVETIDMTSVTALADEHLTVAPCAVIHPG